MFEIKDYEGQISSACSGCAGIAETTANGKTWLTCFGGYKSGECDGPYTMRQFMELED